MQRIFISRKLRPDGAFVRLLSGHDLQVSGHSLLRFEGTSFDAVPDTDWIFFYSRKAVSFFFRRVKELGWTPKQGLRWGAIGSSTAVALEAWEIKADFTGDGHPESTAAGFLKVAQGCRVLFPRAANSRQSIQRALAGRIEAVDLIVYRNEIDPEAPRPEADILVFTSPLNARAYFQQYRPDAGVKIIAIGRTTAATLRELDVTDPIIAPEPSEAGLARAVLSIK